MADTPDISKVIGVLMEHPELMAQISALMNGSEASSSTVETAPSPVTEPTEVAESVSAPARAETTRRKGRSELLYAMKPYLSEKRSKAVDTMLTIAEILDNMRSS